MFRELGLPTGVSGRVFLHAMPGRGDAHDGGLDYATFKILAREEGVDRIICLASVPEIERDAPDYARALRSEDLPCPVELYPIVDYGAPSDLETFDGLVQRAAADLREGRRILIHCAFGIGRTGTFAACLLSALGLSEEAALEAVERAGSSPERRIQEDFVRRFGGAS